MTSITCPKCKGLRRILGLGLIEKDCERCNKTGRIIDPATASEHISTQAESSDKLRTDLRTLSHAYTESQSEVEQLKAQIASLTANKKEPKAKLVGKSK